MILTDIKTCYCDKIKVEKGQFNATGQNATGQNYNTTAWN